MWNESESDAASIIESAVTAYAQSVNVATFPSAVDGLKNVHRRILWVLGTGMESDKVGVWVGAIMSKLHPYGDGSIVDAMQRLMQPWNNIIPLIHTESNVGTYDGDEAGAARYLPARSAAFARDVFFNGINTKTFNYVPAETGKGEEPEYFIPKIPMALLTGSFSIGIGYRTNVAPLNLANLCNLAQEYVRLRATDPLYGTKLHTLYKYLIPDFPSPAIIRNSKQLMANYHERQFFSKIIMDGLLDITPTTITIQTVPPNLQFQAIYTKICNQQKQNNSFISNTFQRVENLSVGKHKDTKGNIDGKAEIELTLRRGVDVFTILNEFKAFISFTQNWFPDPIFITKDSKTQAKMDPFDLLDTWYTERYRSILAEFKHLQTQLQYEFRRLSALIVICGHEVEVAKMFATVKTREDTIKPLCTRFGISTFQAQFISKLRLEQLTKFGTEELVAQRDTVLRQISELQVKFIRINDKIIEDIRSIAKAYVPMAPRRATTPEFIGAVQVAWSGFIQYTSEAELIKILNQFNMPELAIIHYPTGAYNKYLSYGENVELEDELDFPIQFPGRRLTITKHKLKNTIGIRENTIYRLAGLYHHDADDVELIPVADNFIGINNKGIVQLYSANSLPIRKQVVMVGNITDIRYISPLDDAEVLVIHANPREINTLRLDWVSVDGGKITQLPAGKTTIVAVARLNDPLMFSIPKDLLSRCVIQHISIPDIKALFGDKRSLKLAVGSKLFSNGRKLYKHKHGPLYTVEM